MFIPTYRHPLSFGLAVCLLAGSNLTPATAKEVAPSISRKLLLENPVTLPTNRINAKVIRVNFPVGYKTPQHTHDGPGPRLVSKGSVQVVEGDAPAHVYNAGEVFWETGKLMTVENIGNTPAELIIFELAPQP